jgi:septum formation protein
MSVGLALSVLPVDIDETVHDGEAARDYAVRMAAEKCDAAVARLGGQILGKPADEAQAEQMLGQLAGHRHEVLTAYRVRLGEQMVERAVSTQVHFRSLAAKEVAAYLASGEWRGKAGAYAIQGIAGCFVTDLRGSFTNVVGLPLAEVLADLRALQALPGYPPPAFGVSS